MAQPTNLFDRYDGTKAVREDLSDVIYRISPEETPFMSSVGREKASQTFTEWQTDSLAAAVTTNAQIEGDDYALQARTGTLRMGNYTQIAAKVVGVSSTVEVVDKAGIKSYLAYELAKCSAEIKRDMESALLNNQGAVAGNATTARVAAGLPTWLRTNVSRGVGGVNATLSGTTDGFPNAAATDGTTRAFTEALLKTVLQSVWTNGGTPKILMMGPGNKVVASAFAGLAVNRVNQNVKGADMMAIVAAADIYVSDFGKVAFVPNRFQRNRDAFVLDPEYASIAYLRNFKTEELAKTGDSTRKLMTVEYTLKVKQEAAHGVVADLT